MFDGFGAVLDRLQGLLGKGYLLAGFFPVLLAALLSLPLIPLVAPEFPYWVQDALELPAARQAIVGFCVVLVLAFAGFVLSMSNSWFRRLFAAGTFPALGRWFARYQKHRLWKLLETLNRMRPGVTNYRIEVRDGMWMDQLREARIRGHATGLQGPVSPQLLAEIEELERLRTTNQRIPFEQARQVFDKLRMELMRLDADQIADLNLAQLQFRDVCRYAYEQEESEFSRLYFDRRAQFPAVPPRVGPTVLENINAAHRDSMAARYGMNSDIFWPEIEKFAAADEAFRRSLEESKIRLDFAISIAAFAMLFTAVWIVVLISVRAGRGPVCLVAILGPAVAIVFYQIAVWNSYALNAVVRAAVELFRFQVLAAFHCELPADANAERALWAELTKLAELGGGNVTYRHA